MHQTELFDLDPWGRAHGMVVAPHPARSHLHVLLPCVGSHGFAPSDRLTGVWCALIDVNTPVALRFRMPYALLERPDAFWACTAERLTRTLTHLQSDQFIQDWHEYGSAQDWRDPDWWKPNPRDLVWQACESGFIRLQGQMQDVLATGHHRINLVRIDTQEHHAHCVVQEVTRLLSLMPRDVLQVLKTRRNLSWGLICRLMALAPDGAQAERGYIAQALRTEPLPVLERLASNPFGDANASLKAVVLGTRNARDHWRAEGVPPWLRRLAWRDVAALFASPLPYGTWLSLLKLLDKLAVTNRVAAHNLAQAWIQIERQHAISFADYEQMIEVVWRLGRRTHSLYEDLLGMASNLSSPALRIDGPLGHPHRWAQVMHTLRQSSTARRLRLITMMCKPSTKTLALLSLLVDLGIQEVTERLNDLLEAQPDVPKPQHLPAHYSVRGLRTLRETLAAGEQLQNCLTSTKTVLAGLTRARALYLIVHDGTPVATLAIQRDPKGTGAFRLKCSELTERANAAPSEDTQEAANALIHALEQREQQWRQFEKATSRLSEWAPLLASARHVIVEENSHSISLLQRRLHLGYNMAQALALKTKNHPSNTQ